MPIMKFNPFSNDTDEFPVGLRLFQDTVSRMLEPGARPWSPPVDIFETPNELVFKADLPDVNPDEVEIRLENGTLVLKGERKLQEKEEGKGFHRLERSYGSFVRAFSIPDSVDPQNVKADYKNGVLSVVLGKKEVAKPRSIKIQVNNN